MPVYRARVLTPVDPDHVRYADDALVVVDGTGKLRVGSRIVDARGDKPPAATVEAASRQG